MHQSFLKKINYARWNTIPQTLWREWSVTLSLPSMDLSAPPDDVELCAATAEFGGGGAHIADEQLVACIAVRS